MVVLLGQLTIPAQRHVMTIGIGSRSADRRQEDLARSALRRHCLHSGTCSPSLCVIFWVFGGNLAVTDFTHCIMLLLIQGWLALAVSKRPIMIP